jgi:HD-GYP domain-containing protein (c-di-GMP phosphodiesterase class II)
VLPVVGVAGAAAAVPAAAYAATAGPMLMLPPIVHLLVVGGAGALAIVAATALSAVGARRNDGRTVLLAIAFSVMAAMLLVHAIATPGVFFPMNGVVQLAGVLNLPLSALILAASAHPALRRPHGVRTLQRLQLVAVGVILAAGAAALADPGLIPALPASGSPAAHATFAFGAAALSLLVWRAARTYLLTRRRADLLVTVGGVWLIGAEFGLLQFSMDIPFYVAHLFELAGIGLLGIPAALDLRHGVASRPLVGDLHAADLVADEEAFLGGRVRALMVRLAEKDPSTEGHTRRVATLAVQIGERLGLPATRLRQLALGGLLHDMGKLSVPDEILTKPGRLTDEEFAVIRRHPGWGRELLGELGGFSRLVLDLVESHHERLDGRGYPHRWPAAELPLEVRILTVADVYDALTADRVYREAWSPERAFEVIDADIGTAFDRSCVAALREVVRPAEAPAWQATVSTEAPAPTPPRPAPRTLAPRPGS